MVNKINFEGKTIEEALSKAAEHFGVEKALLYHERIQNKKEGNFFSRLFAPSIVQIQAWVDSSHADLQEEARRIVQATLQSTQTTDKQHTNRLHKEDKKTQRPEKKEPLVQKSHGQPKAAVEQSHKENKVAEQNWEGMEKAIQEIKEFHAIFQKAFLLSQEDTSVQLVGDRIEIHLVDDTLEKILSKSQKLSLAYEHIVKRIVQKKVGEMPHRVILLCGNSVQQHEEHLIAMAHGLAQKVLATGKSMTLSSKSSQERRTIHLALSTVDGIATRSIGEREHRKLVIYKARPTSKKKTPSNKETTQQTKTAKPRLGNKKQVHTAMGKKPKIRSTKEDPNDAQ